MTEPFPVLVSYAYLRNQSEEYIGWLFSQEDLTVMLDSGAFTVFNAGGKIDVQDYITFLQKWKKYIKDYIALDVINEPKETRKNLSKMCRHGLRPIPVFVTGENAKWMDRLFAQSKLVAIPTGVTRRVSVKKMFIKIRMEWAGGRDVHWLGFAHKSSITRWKPYSCDVSSWGAGARFGDTRIYHGLGKWSHVNYALFRKKTKHRDSVLRETRRLGYDDDMVFDKHYWKCNTAEGVPLSLHIPLMVTMDSFIRYARDIRKRFGTRLYFVVQPGASTSNHAYWLVKSLRGLRPAEITERVKWDLYK